MAGPLRRYQEMRDFSSTPEPRGRAAAARGAAAPRFYVQRHAAHRLHYDFRLELDGVLKSWAVPKGPSLDPRERRLAVQTEDHPLEYGEFEGVIPEKQYGAGEVLLWDRGEWRAEDRDPGEALERGRLHFRLQGEKLHGRWTLARMAGGDWLLIKRRDADARSGGEAEVTALEPQSVKRPPRRARRAAAAPLPQFVSPQLATLVSAPPAGAGWLYEVKHDGYRLLARIVKDEVRLYTRSGRDWTGRMPHLARALATLGLAGAWLDGEVVVTDEKGHSSFQRLQNAFDSGADAAMVYWVFDAPFLGGRDLRRLALAERKRRLQAALSRHPSEAVRFSDHMDADGRRALEQACRLGLEGLIGKRADAVYVSGRTKSWVKLKCRRRQEFVIGGFTAPAGARKGFGALLVGAYDAAGRLGFAGKVGTGFDDATLDRLSARLASLRREASPFAPAPREKGARWVRPALVAEVAYTERTEDGVLRHPSFLGLREDRDPKTVTGEVSESPPRKEDPEKKEKNKGNVIRGIAITHPDRLMWADEGITKLDLARYYEAVGERLLPHVANRPLTLVRCPDGAEAQCFFQRHLGMGGKPGDIGTFRRERSSKGSYLFVNTLEAVIRVVQHGAVELHTWGATLPDVRRPDRLTLDLDPDPELPWEKLREATRLTRALLDGLGLASFLKTTGGKGLHVVVPVAPRLGWEEAKAFARDLARTLAKARPDLFTANMAKPRRAGKVYVDYLRNGETASAVAAFSARARAGAPVSIPLAWEELDDDPRGRFTVKSVPRRLARLGADPWAGYAQASQAITAAMRRAAAGA